LVRNTRTHLKQGLDALPFEKQRTHHSGRKIKNGSGIFLKLSTPKVVRAIEAVCRSYGGVVGSFRWLTERQFVDAVAVAMITPGPLVITWGRLSSRASLAMY
jgi:hypothetical protein